MSSPTAVAAASLALRDAPVESFTMPEGVNGPRFPNGYVPLDHLLADACRPGARRDRLRPPFVANRWWDSRVVVRPLRPDIVVRFLDAVDPIVLPHSPASCIGLGPGLTPAGDDVVVGMLVGFIAAGETGRARALAEACAAVETVPFSRSLIDHAAQGRAARPLLDLVAALAGHGRLRRAMTVLDDFGATSGRHLLDGVRRALLEAEAHRSMPDPLHEGHRQPTAPAVGAGASERS